MLKKVKDFCKANAKDIRDTFLVAGASVLLVSIIVVGRVAAYLA